MFPIEITECVFRLRNIRKTRKTSVLANFPIIEIIKHHKDREISIKLFYYSNTESLELQPPDSKFFSTISYYDYKKPERRWTRNKDFIFSVIRDLKKSGLWKFISNKDMVIINSFNKKTDAVKLLENLRSLVDDEPSP